MNNLFDRAMCRLQVIFTFENKTRRILKARITDNIIIQFSFENRTHYMNILVFMLIPKNPHNSLAGVLQRQSSYVYTCAMWAGRQVLIIANLITLSS